MEPSGAEARDRSTLVAIAALGSEIRLLEDESAVRACVVARMAGLLDADVTVWSVAHQPERHVRAARAEAQGTASPETPQEPDGNVREALRTGAPLLVRDGTKARGIVAPYTVLSRTEGVIAVVAPHGRPDLDASDLAACLAVAERLGSELGARRLLDDYRDRAEHDPLTGLPNRTSLIASLDDAVDAAERGAATPLVIFLDVNQFKLVNDSLGHAAGDAVLRAVARRLRDEIREDDVVARFGGDEFVVVMRDHMSEDDVHAVLDRLTGPGEEPLVILGHRVFVTLSAGLARWRPGARTGALLSQADAAMFQAKESSSARWREFDDGMKERAAARLRDQSELRDALVRSELFCEFQPVIDLASGEVVAHEALVRWQHPSRGRIEPAGFIATAEADGLMHPLTEQVLAQALAAAAGWPGTVAVTVNVSPSLVADSRLVPLVLDALEAARVAPHRLLLEITETAVMTERERALAHLDALHGEGVRIAVDDFGTGYTSVDDLLRLPLDVLKIDSTFVAASATPRGRAMLAALTAMAEGLGVPAVAEGVESATLLYAAREAGCTLAQGFYIGRPVPPQDVEQKASPRHQ